FKSALSRLAGLSLYWFGRVGTRDATNSFKAYSTDFVRQVGIDSDTGFEIGIELVAKARRLRLRTAEIPTIWLERAHGTSSFPVVGGDNRSKYGPVRKSYDDDPRYMLAVANAEDVSVLTELAADCDHLIAGAAMIGGISYFHTFAYDLLASNERIIAATCDAA